MQKIYVLIFCLILSPSAFSQKKKPNPKVGRNETEITASYIRDTRRGMYNPVRDALGAQFVYRFPVLKYTKLGVGALIAADYSQYDSHVYPYGVAFADITQFIGKRQKWSGGIQAGYGFYKREYEFYSTTSGWYIKFTGGMNYSFSVSYRAIISEKVLLIISPFLSKRNFRLKAGQEYNSPPSSNQSSQIEKHSGFGLRVGIVL